MVRAFVNVKLIINNQYIYTKNEKNGEKISKKNLFA